MKEVLKRRLSGNIVAIYSISLITSLPGLAIAPILGELETIFKDSSKFDLQLLETLPSIVIIPFMFLSGRLSISMDKRWILVVGLSLFVFSSIAYLFTTSLWAIQINGILLGAGAGLVIPLSTGYIADYFKGDNRIAELGIISGISNIVLVLATLFAGFLANISWRYAFLVYIVSVIPLILSKKIKDKPRDNTQQAVKFDLRNLDKKIPLNVLWVYFVATLIALVVPMNLSLLLQSRNIGSEVSGAYISVFFLAMMLPGFLVATILRIFKRYTQMISYCMMLVGNLIFIGTKSEALLVVAVVFIGLGYGAIQPIVYDYTSKVTNPAYTTFALSIVMSMNYFAILFYPEIISLVSLIFGSDQWTIPFIVCCSLALALMFSSNYYDTIMGANPSLAEPQKSDDKRG